MVGSSSFEQPKAAPLAKVFNCPNCGSGVTVRAQGLSISVVCKGCGSVIDVNDENHRILSQAAEKRRVEPLIPLGQRGKIHGVTWEVIGYMRRCDRTGIYSWSEYLLFNPMKGFRWLTEFDGHWNYVVQIKEKPKLQRQSRGLTGSQEVAKVLGKTYALFHEGTAKVIYVLGEFYWRVAVGDVVQVKDYICPPEILSSESSGNEIVWSIGEYLSDETVKSGFQIQSRMPLALGIAPNQPCTLAPLRPFVGRMWSVFAVMVFVIQAFMVLFSKQETVYQGSFNYVANDPEKQKVTPSFELKDRVSGVEIYFSAPVDNSWLELQGDLVNDQTGDSEDFEEGVEFYSGYDSDGYWSEGRKATNKSLSSVPAGTYHLNLQVSGPATQSLGAPSVSGGLPNSVGMPYTVTVRGGVINWSNFIWSMVLLGAVPLVLLWKSRSFEKARWSTSDFSPYWSEED